MQIAFKRHVGQTHTRVRGREDLRKDFPIPFAWMLLEHQAMAVVVLNLTEGLICLAHDFVHVAVDLLVQRLRRNSSIPSDTTGAASKREAHHGLTGSVIESQKCQHQSTASKLSLHSVRSTPRGFYPITREQRVHVCTNRDRGEPRAHVK